MKKLMLKLVVCLGVALALTGAALLSSAQSTTFKVVVNQDNPTTDLTSKDVSNFLLKKKTRWTNVKERVAPIDLDANNQTREYFSQKIHKRSVASIKNYWQRQIFSGENVPPPEVASDADVLDHVRNNPGAIGYVSASAQVSGVRVVTVAN